MTRAAHATLVALVSVMLVSAASAAPAAKQHVAIELTFYPSRTFVLGPEQAGALKGDLGRISKIPELTGRATIRGGQTITVYNPTWTLRGKQGALTIRERNEWVSLGSDANNDGIEDSVAFGTWKVVRGSGQYAGVTGGGRSAHAGLGRAWNARYDGFLTRP